MAVDSTERRVVYAGNGKTTAFPFAFKVFADTDVVVSVGKPDGAEAAATLKINSDYTVTLNADQNTTPGGTVNVKTAPDEGYNLAVTSSVPYDQPMVLTPYGGFNPETLNDNSDRQAIQIQQLVEQVSRALITDPTDTITPRQLRDKLLAAAASALDAAAKALQSETNATSSAATSKEYADKLLAFKDQIVTVSDNIKSVGITAENAEAITEIAKNLEELLKSKDYAAEAKGWAEKANAITGGQAIIASGTTFPRSPIDRFADVVNVKDFGAVGNGAHDDTAAIQAAIDYAGGKVGGTVFFPAGTYIVHNPSPDRSSGFYPKYFALYMPYSNVRLAGAGIGVTKIKCKNTDASYGVLAMAVMPIVNGAPQISNTSVLNMTLDGNSETFDLIKGVTRTPVVYAVGLRNSQFRNLVVMNSNMYGIGLENGGHQNITIDTCTFIKCGRDAIDNKNNGSVNRNIYINNVSIINCGFGNYEASDSPNEGIGIACPTAKITNVSFFQIPTNGKLGGLIHVKPNSQGTGSEGVVIDGIHAIFDGTEYTNMQGALDVKNVNARISNVVLKGHVSVGIRLQQPSCTVTNCYIEGAEKGIYVTQKTTVGENYELYPRATNSTVFGNVIKNCDQGVCCEAENLVAIANSFESCGVGISLSGIYSTRSTVVGNSFTDCTEKIKAQVGQLNHTWLLNGEGTQSITTLMLNGTESGLDVRAKNLFRVNVDDCNPLAAYSSTTLADGYMRTGAIQPRVDNAYALGTGSLRWSQVYAATGTINTSDERAKTGVTDTDDALMRAWGKVNFKVFQFKDAVEKKGGDARIHVGVIAQEVKAAFESEGLDASRYGLFCHDTWEDEYEDVTVVDQPEVADDDGNIATPEVSHVEKRLVTAAGDRYGIRYEEALALECAYQRWRLAQIEARF